VRGGNLEDLRAAFRLSSCLWGGIDYPIIVIDDRSEAIRFISLFQVDVLFPAQQATEIIDFISSFPYLKWPLLGRDSLFVEASAGLESQLLDLAQCIVKVEYYLQRRMLGSDFTPSLLEWGPADPLADALLAMFGGFPDSDEMREDYKDLLVRRLGAATIKVDS